MKPDKLQLLLQKTQFGCVEKKDGYYADEELDCEVFHYCQDRVRHSWLCPEGASFHQVIHQYPTFMFVNYMEWYIYRFTSSACRFRRRTFARNLPSSTL